MERAEVSDALGVGWGRGKELVLSIAPNQCVRQGVVAEDGQQHPIPPTGVRHIGKPALGECDELVMLSGKLAEHVEVGARLTNEVFICAPLVGIKADQINALVTRVPL